MKPKDIFRIKMTPVYFSNFSANYIKAFAEVNDMNLSQATDFIVEQYFRNMPQCERMILLRLQKRIKSTQKHA